MKSIKETFWLIVLIVIFTCAILHFFGCAGAKEAAAEATYLGQQLECVDHLNTRADIDGCRASVRKRWGIVETARDAGKGYR